MDQYIPRDISPKELDLLIKGNIDRPFIVDVREDSEIEIARFPFCDLNLPLSKSSDWILDIHKFLPRDQAIVIVCHSGVRSFNFGAWLLEKDLACKVYNLVGGIDAWSVEVDNSINRY